MRMARLGNPLLLMGLSSEIQTGKYLLCTFYAFLKSNKWYDDDGGGDDDDPSML